VRCDSPPDSGVDLLFSVPELNDDDTRDCMATEVRGTSRKRKCMEQLTDLIGIERYFAKWLYLVNV
jgi:hypothetical protein